MNYCDVCGKNVEAKIINKNEIYDVCGEKVEVAAEVMVCPICGEELFNEELDSATLIQAYNEYRRRHKLLLPEEIKEIRERYGLSQRSFAKLLNWGDKTVNRYENGAIQDRAHNSLLVFLREPKNMRTYLAENEVLLPEKQKERLLKTVERLEQNEGVLIVQISPELYRRAAMAALTKGEAVNAFVTAAIVNALEPEYDANRLQTVTA